MSASFLLINKIIYKLVQATEPQSKLLAQIIHIYGNNSAAAYCSPLLIQKSILNSSSFSNFHISLLLLLTIICQNQQ